MNRNSFIQRMREADRKLHKRNRRSENGPWFGLGLFGLVGWSVALPTIAGTAIGIFIDAKFGTERSWTLILLGGGLITGCVNAWFWVSQERKKIFQEEENHE